MALKITLTKAAAQAVTALGVIIGGALVSNQAEAATFKTDQQGRVLAQPGRNEGLAHIAEQANAKFKANIDIFDMAQANNLSRRKMNTVFGNQWYVVPVPVQVQAAQPVQTATPPVAAKVESAPLESRKVKTEIIRVEPVAVAPQVAAEQAPTPNQRVRRAHKIMTLPEQVYTPQDRIKAQEDIMAVERWVEDRRRLLALAPKTDDAWARVGMEKLRQAFAEGPAPTAAAETRRTAETQGTIATGPLSAAAVSPVIPAPKATPVETSSVTTASAVLSEKPIDYTVKRGDTPDKVLWEVAIERLRRAFAERQPSVPTALSPQIPVAAASEPKTVKLTDRVPQVPASIVAETSQPTRSATTRAPAVIAEAPLPPAPVVPVVSSPLPAPAKAATAEIPVATAALPVKIAPHEYIVKRGDVLEEIAERFNKSCRASAASSGIKDWNKIQVGDKINLDTPDVSRSADCGKSQPRYRYRQAGVATGGAPIWELV